MATDGQTEPASGGAQENRGANGQTEAGQWRLEINEEDNLKAILRLEALPTHNFRNILSAHSTN